MYALPWLVTVAIAVGATFAWGVLDRRRLVMTAAGTGTWSILAFASASITQVTESGATVTYQPAFFQYIAAFFAVISFAALWAVAWWGNLPDARPERGTAEPPET